MNVEGLDRIQAYFQTRKHRIQNPRPFFEKCIEILSASASKTWDMRGRPAWAPRKDDKPHPLMEKTGRLRQSMESRVATDDAVVKMSVASGDAWLEKGTSVFYGKFHQFGTRKMVARPFVQLHDEDVEAIRKAEDYFFKD